MASLVGLATALLWQIILFVSLHNGSQTLADDMYSNDLCWYPNGQWSGLGWPCTDDGSPSNCCPEGFVCMNTGVCKLKGHDYYERQSCTDRKWLDPSCSKMCLSDSSGAFSSNWTVVKACKHESKKETSYCCFTVSGLDTDCREQTMAPGYIELWDFGNMDVHGTALILDDGRVSSIPVTDKDGLSTSAASTSSAPAPPITEVSTSVMTLSPTDPTEPSVVTVTINNTIPAELDHPVAATSPSNFRIGATSTISYRSSDFATPTLVVDAEPDQGTATKHRPTIIGVAVGVPIGLIGIALLLYVLRRYLRYRQSCTATVYFPPDPIDPFATRIISKIELDAIPNAIHELDGKTAPSELDDNPNAALDPKRPPSIVSELEGSPVTPSSPAGCALAATTLDKNRWSNVSSLAPPQAHRTMATGPFTAEALSIVSQQHHGSGQDVFLTPPRPHASHRLSRPTSGVLPEIGVSDDDIPLIPKLSTVTVSKQGSDDSQESREGEQAIAAQETNGGEHVTTSESARTSGEAAQAGETAPAGEKLHEGETTNEGEASPDIGSDAQVQVEEAIQASQITSEVEEAHKSEDSQRSDLKLQASEDMQAGEKQHKGTASQGADTQTQSGD